MNPGTLAEAIVEMRRLRRLSESIRHGGTQSNVRSKACQNARSELWRLLRIYLPELLDEREAQVRRIVELELGLKKVLDAHPRRVGYEIEEARALAAGDAVLRRELGIGAFEGIIVERCAAVCNARAELHSHERGNPEPEYAPEAAVEAERCADDIRSAPRTKVDAA
jgi:hypothetical protein